MSDFCINTDRGVTIIARPKMPSTAVPPVVLYMSGSVGGNAFLSRDQARELGEHLLELAKPDFRVGDLVRVTEDHEHSFARKGQVGLVSSSPHPDRLELSKADGRCLAHVDKVELVHREEGAA